MSLNGSPRCHRSIKVFVLLAKLFIRLQQLDMVFFDALLKMMDLTGASNKSETIPASEDPPQYDGIMPMPRHRSIPCGWPEPDDRSELIAEIENLQRVCRELWGRLEKNQEDARQARQSQVCSTEKLRRQGELLGEARQRADAALKENRELVSKLAQLQRWTDCLDDEEAARSMCKLYQDLQTWIGRHFRSSPLATSTEHMEANTSSKGVSSQRPDLAFLERVSEISMEISWHIFNSILTRVMVGWQEDFGQHLYQLDKHINETCKSPFIFLVQSFNLTGPGPSHVWQHWRSATSNAEASLAHERIDADCDRIVRRVEKRFAHHSATNYRKRTGELKSLLWQAIDFKKRLESQGDFYYFWRSSLNRPFRSEHMVSLTADDPSDEVVKSSVWPMLYKSVPGGEVIVQRELVTTIRLRAHCALEGSCSQGETEDESP